MIVTMSGPLPMSTPMTEPAAGRAAVSEESAGAWRSLTYELDSWATAGQPATFWWRDDDAVDVTPALHRLRALSTETGVPVAISVVPMHAQEALVAFVDAWPSACVLQHGYDHDNHAPEGAKKTELAAGRPLGALLADVERGREALHALFGDKALPVLVPPWNRISSALVAALPKLGMHGLSAFKGLKVAPRPVVEVNTHVDVINWRGRVFVGERVALATAVDHLRARRLGSEDRTEPTGLLSHHLVMDEAAWHFVATFLAVTKAHPAARWLDPRTVFKPAP